LVIVGRSLEEISRRKLIYSERRSRRDYRYWLNGEGLQSVRRDCMVVFDCGGYRRRHCRLTAATRTAAACGYRLLRAAARGCCAQANGGDTLRARRAGLPVFPLP